MSYLHGREAYPALDLISCGKFREPALPGNCGEAEDLIDSGLLLFVNPISADFHSTLLNILDEHTRTCVERRNA